MTAVNSLLEVNVKYPDATEHNIAPNANGTLTFERGNDAGIVDNLQPGQLSIDILGDTYSPAENSNVRPRRQIAVRAKDDTNTFRTIWIGTLESPEVTYRKDRLGSLITRLAAVDAFGVTARFPANPDLVMNGTKSFGTRVSDLGGDFGFVINQPISGTENTPANTETWSDVTAGLTGTRLEALERVRNQMGGSIWADRDTLYGIMYRADKVTPPTLPMASDSNADTTAIKYTQIDIGHAVTTFVNAITFEKADGTTYGPYVDSTTTSEWSRTEAAIPMMSTVPWSGNPKGLAEYWFEYEPAPGIVVRSITFDALKRRDLFALDPIDRTIRVKHTPSGHDAIYIVTKEIHRVTETSWFTTYNLKPFTTMSGATYPGQARNITSSSVVAE